MSRSIGPFLHIVELVKGRGVPIVEFFRISIVLMIGG
jgi:hypothetical protein